MGLFDKMKENHAAKKEAAQKKFETCGNCITFILNDDGSNTMLLYEKGIEFMTKDESLNPGFRTWDEIKSVSIEDATELESRVTATRLLLIGIFAFAAKKKTGGSKFIVVEGEDFLWPMEVGHKKVPAANNFVMKARSMNIRAKSN